MTSAAGNCSLTGPPKPHIAIRSHGTPMTHLVLLTPAAFASCAAPATGPRPRACIVPPFEQAVRTFVRPDAITRPDPLTHVRDRFGHRYAVSDAGLVVEHPAGARFVLTGADGLPVEELSCLALAPNGDLWLGSDRGAVRWTGGRFEYYAGRRWLPDDRVTTLECLPDGSARVWTATGLSHIRFQSTTLAQKAEHYEALTDARHRRFGFVTGCRLLERGDLSRTRHCIDDNDGLWTAMYVAAQSFRYAVTRSEDARRKARESLLAILELEVKTPIAGFPARALTHHSEPEFGRHTDGEWHRTPDGEWEWKGDTSSDEMDGHYFAWGIYYDLVAGERDKGLIRDACRRVTDYIVGNGFYLLDIDGKPTRWGVWAPERLNDDPRWRAERGLNSLEMLSYLKVAQHITGNHSYSQAYRDLVETHHYAHNALEQKVMPGDFPGAENNHSDDELAFLAYCGLLTYEDEPQLRALYVASIERSWQVERPEKCPLWSFIYGAVTGRPCDAEAGAESLCEIPLDLVEWRAANSHRADLRLDPDPDRGGRPQVLRPLPWRERPLHKWNGNPYVVDGGSDLREECATFWLLPYWMGRYHGLIAESE